VAGNLQVLCEECNLGKSNTDSIDWRSVMAVMGFRHDPGELPFTTIRDAKWANRLSGHSTVEIQGEHGCTMPMQWALVKSVEPFTGELPAHLACVYKGRALVEITLEKLKRPGVT
jgi:hypothetical protein